jgi:hypothetical protein
MGYKWIMQRQIHIVKKISQIKFGYKKYHDVSNIDIHSIHIRDIQPTKWTCMVIIGMNEASYPLVAAGKGMHNIISVRPLSSSAIILGGYYSSPKVIGQ